MVIYFNFIVQPPVLQYSSDIIQVLTSNTKHLRELSVRNYINIQQIKKIDQTDGNSGALAFYSRLRTTLENFLPLLQRRCSGKIRDVLLYVDINISMAKVGLKSDRNLLNNGMYMYIKLQMKDKLKQRDTRTWI